MHSKAREKNGGMSEQVVSRSMRAQPFDGFSLLDVVRCRGADTDLVTLIFDNPIPDHTVSPPVGARLKDEKVLGGAYICQYEVPVQSPAEFVVESNPVQTSHLDDELSLLAGRNCFAAVRNGENVQIVLDWLAFHEAHQQLQGAVILDRARPEEHARFAQELRDGMAERQLASRIVLLGADVPLGKADLPSEAHPFCVPEAPGKDRMTPPAPSQWDSPLGVVAIYEIMRARFLDSARAVANVDVHDLILPAKLSVFDTAVAAEDGIIVLDGRHCYPWRLRKGAAAQFGDHICMQFDASTARKRWCVVPEKLPENAIWRLVRIGHVSPRTIRTYSFYRCMALRHPTPSISKIVPKSSLVESQLLLNFSQNYWGHNAVRVPAKRLKAPVGQTDRRAIVTTMKNEGPFILEWLAHHRALGFDDILVYTNDCDDGTDTMLALLERKGIVQHRENPFRKSDLKPQHAALRAAEDEPMIRNAGWLACIDVDEYVNIKCGDGTLDALFAAVPDANMIAMTWRLFGNADIAGFDEEQVTTQFDRCAPEYANKPHQAWGFKTLFRNMGVFRKLGVHRPKGLNPQLVKHIEWVNGSGKPLPEQMYRNGWRSTKDTYGYDLVQLNHYAVRSAESFLVKRDRGRVNHVGRDQGLAYWFRMNNNLERDTSILRMQSRVKAQLDAYLSDPEIAAAHAFCVSRHREKIRELRSQSEFEAFYQELTSPRMQRLSRLHGHFGAHVFLSGPAVVPQEVVDQDPAGDWFFTVEYSGQAEH